MDPGSESSIPQDATTKHEPVDGGTHILPLQPPPPPPPPVPAHFPAPPDMISKAVHHDARHRMAAKKPVMIQRCEICNIELVGQVVIDAHMKGSKHAKKLKAQELLNNLIDAGQIRLDEIHFKSNTSEKIPAPFKCDLCKVMLNSTQQLEVHYAGAKHKAKVSEVAGNKQNPDAAASVGSSETGGEASDSETSTPGVKPEKPKPMLTNPLDLVCTVCSITVNSPQQLEQHLNSKKHQDREAGRSSHRPGPYSRGGRGGRGGLGSHGRGGKGASSKFTSLSNSFKSAGYSNTFIKPEGGVIMPSNCGTNKGSSQPAPQQAAKGSNMGGQFKNRGNFGSLTPYVSEDNGGRGGYNHRGGTSRGGWSNSSMAYGAHPGYSGYEYDHHQYGYGYGYENVEGYGGYGMMPSGPPPTY